MRSRRSARFELPAGRVTMLGTTDDVTQCECCGRDDLKSTVALSVDDGDPVYFGTSCAARALKRTSKEIRQLARAADDEKRAAKERENERARMVVFERQRAWLDARVPELRGERFEQIQRLGGWAALEAQGFPR